MTARARRGGSRLQGVLAVKGIDRKFVFQVNPPAPPAPSARPAKAGP